MANDSLLKALGKVAREQRAADDTGPVEPIAPPSAALIEQLAGRALDDLAAFERPAPARTAPARTRKPWWWTIGLVAPLAVAAAALLWMRPGQGPALPGYTLTVAGGTAEFRAAGAPEASPVLTPGTRFEATLRPEVAATTPVGARLYWVKDGRGVPWDAQVEGSETGALRARGMVAAPFGPGAGELWAVVGRPDDLPTSFDQVKAAADGRWQILRRPVLWP